MNDKEAETIAAWKFNIISPALSGIHGYSSQSQYLRHAAEHTFVHPISKKSVRFKFNTLRSWVWLYRSGGYEALKPGVRKDLGTFRSLPAGVCEQTIDLIRQFPRVPNTVIRSKLLELGVIDASVSQATVNRLIRSLVKEGKLEADLDKKDRRAFEAAHVNEIWQADTTYLFELKGRRLYLILIIDDASRMAVGHGIYYHDNALNFQKTLRQAITKYGRPSVLYTDNGAPYANDQLEIICAKAQISHVRAPVRDGAAKGKVERCNRSLKERWLYAVDWNKFETIEDAGKSFSDWLYRDYINKPHSALQDDQGNPISPRQRLLAEENPFRFFSEQELAKIFRHQYNRKVKKDSTFTIQNVQYETDSAFAGMKIVVQLDPQHPESGTFSVEHTGETGEYRMLDKQANTHIPRKKKVSFQQQEEDKK